MTTLRLIKVVTLGDAKDKRFLYSDSLKNDSSRFKKITYNRHSAREIQLSPLTLVRAKN